MRTLITIYTGQLVSRLGSGIANFGLMLWLFDHTGKALAVSLSASFYFVPMFIAIPLAGVLADRWHKKKIIVASNFISAAASATLLAAHHFGVLAPWHLYLAQSLYGVCATFQEAAFNSSVSSIVNRDQLPRANGLISFVESGSNAAAPLFGGLLLAATGLLGVLAFDVISFLFANLLMVPIEIPRASSRDTTGSVLERFTRDMLLGFRYIWNSGPLLRLQTVFSGGNFLAGMTFPLLTVIVLSRTGHDEVVMGTVRFANSIGATIAGLVLMIRGGPRRRIEALSLCFIGIGLFGWLAQGLGQNLPAWAIGGFCAMAFLTVANACSQSIWQSSVPAELQGRVFAARRFIGQCSFPLSLLLSGYLADDLFQTLLKQDAIPGFMVRLVGTGAAAPAELLMVMIGGMMAVLGGAGLFVLRSFDETFARETVVS